MSARCRGWSDEQAASTWDLRDSLQNITALAIDPLDPGTLYSVVNYDGGVYKSTDDGATWSAFNNGLTDRRVQDLTIDHAGRFLHAATSTGVYSVKVREDTWTVGGRVLTPDCRGLRNATVSLTNPNGVSRITTTSSFGLFSFDAVVTGAQYTISVRSHLFRFMPQTVSVNGDLTLADFVGLE